MNKIFETLTDLELLTTQGFLEARGEGLDGVLAVNSAAVNRAKKPYWWGRTLKECILKPAQFSCFNEKDNPEYELALKITADFNGYLKLSETFKACYWIAKGVLEGMLLSNVGNATHYHAVGSLPDWTQSKGMLFIRQVGKHRFYVE